MAYSLRILWILLFSVKLYAHPVVTDDTFVFSGGGVKGVAYVGALQAYQDITGQKISSIKNVVGTSAGSITALLVALGLSVEEIKQVLWSIDFSKFEDGSGKIINAGCLYQVYGWYRGEVLYQFLRTLIKDRGYSPDISFEALYKETGINLTVFVTNLSTNSAQAFNGLDDKTKGVSVAFAVRASASLPLFFDAVFFNQDGNGNLNMIPKNKPCDLPSQDLKTATAFLDGGIMNNYPINYGFKLSQQSGGGGLLGFILLSPSQMNWFKTGDTPLEKSNEVHPGGYITQYAMQLVNSVTTPQYEQFVKNKKVLNATVMIDDLNISTTAFTLSDEQKKALVESGYKAVSDYFGNPAIPLKMKSLQQITQTPSGDEKLFRTLDNVRKQWMLDKQNTDSQTKNE